MKRSGPVLFGSAEILFPLPYRPASTFPLALLMIHLARKKKVQQETSHNEKKLKVTEAIQEILENMPDIKAFGRKERTLTQLGERQIGRAHV